MATAGRLDGEQLMVNKLQKQIKSLEDRWFINFVDEFWLKLEPLGDRNFWNYHNM